MGRTSYFNDELARLRRVWLSAVRRHDSDGARDASTSYFLRAEELELGAVDGDATPEGGEAYLRHTEPPGTG